MRRLLAIATLTLLAACSEPESDPAESVEDFAQRAGVGAATGTAASVAEVNAQPVVASTGAAQLTPLAVDAPKVLGPIAGGCSFVYQGRSLLVVGAPDGTDARGQGVLVIDGQQVVLPGSAAGGPQVVESGPTLSGAGYTVNVLRADGAPQVANRRNEWTASLRVAGPQGDTTFSPGTWSCTP
jgi:ABC-type Fe3+-hydroxamate transport system substrate-binding protein